MRTLAALATVLALAACGVKRDLKPAAGHRLPPAPYGREEPRSTAALLQPPVQAIPERNVELRRRSEEREDDPFDLPPTSE
ncbi:MAG: lipoprotein [Novosphingobium sp.]|nr:lipoprotein [Novosphingobium sp.]